MVPGRVMSITISSSALLGYYQAKAGLQVTSGSTSSTGASSSASSTSGSSTAPTPPWKTAQTSQQTNAAIQNALGGQSLFNPKAVKVSVANASANYKNLFALYQGLLTLQDLANQAGASGETAAQLSQLQAAFSNGVGQLQTFLGSSPFQGFSVAQGAVNAQATTKAGVAAETDTYTTGVLATGSSNTPVAAFAGAVQFAMTVTLPSGAQKVVNFNLNDMGSTPRTLSNVVSYLNGQLKAAGVTTNFSVKMTEGQPSTTTVNGQTLTTPAGPNTYSLQINGNSVEKLSFSAATSSPAVYLTQTVGNTTSTTTGTAPDAEQQLVKLTTDPTASDAKVFSDTLASVEQNAIATQTAPDGSVYVLANVTGTTPAGEVGAAQNILGSQDVALLKYDSAGNLLSSQVVGASNSASGYGLAVSADGGEVAVTGTATGVMTASGSSSSTSTSTAFVSVFSSAGQPLWTQTVNAGSSGQVNQAAFGSDGSVYVTGTSTISGTTITNNFLAGFSATGTQKFVTTLGPTSQGYVTGLAVSGSQIVTAGVQNGDAVLQSYQIASTGAPSLTATRDLGALQGGNVAGLAVNSDGSIIVGGSTHNGALSAGTVTNAYASGEEGWVANLSANLAPSSSDTLAYYGASGDVRVSAITAAGGQAYIAGQIVGSSSGSTTYDGFAAQIDPQTGTTGWSDQYTGLDNKVAPNSISVSVNGASALDALGLPTGPLDFAPTQTVAATSNLPGVITPASSEQTLVANSALRAGQQFTIDTNYSGFAQTITIAPTDTLQTLATKISQASGFQATATVVTSNGVQSLQIKPSFPGVRITLGAGPDGKNALPALGLSEGVITSNATAKAAKAGAATTASNNNSLKANYALSIPSTLDLTTSAGVKQAQAVLGAAIATVKQTYTDMTTPTSTTKGNNTGTAPAYITSEIASYQAALARLQGSG